MKSNEIRNTFLEFFKSKKHEIVASAPMVIKDDPSLMFTNAGMNQFKDIFLGNAAVKHLRIADTQKCLRVSGKHNDLEEVGHDTYHHTMFEMLGNWSFGDYFKKEAIQWGWELLTKVYAINPDTLYATVFEGNREDGIPEDSEAYNCWKEIIDESRILYGNKKDNFWEMGETGPCGPCSEIHVDLRSEEDKKSKPGRELVNKDHPEVIEIWNLVFIQYNRSASGQLNSLPAKHIDTGMGFERLCMVLQGKTSNYDTDVFQPLIKELESISGKRYGKNKETDIAIRVCADHIRAVAFAIADGQIPSNTGAGYVIRRILRRAVRYGFTFLELKEAFLFELLPVLVKQMSYIFPELEKQQELIRKVIIEEESSFLRTLEQGLKLFDQYTDVQSSKSRQLQKKYNAQEDVAQKMVNGIFAFELFDTYGFPIDLTKLIAREKGWDVDMQGFQEGMKQQRERSRKAAEVETGDWVIVRETKEEPEFVGYDQLESQSDILRYRKVNAKKKSFYEIVLNKTPFYAESGGQVGDKGYLETAGKKIEVFDTVYQNRLIVHLCKDLPENPKSKVTAKVDANKRKQTANNHSATHLLHKALKMVLGEHVEQKGSLVEPERLRFDFSHFSKMTEEEIRKVEKIVNARIRENIRLQEHREIPMSKAQEMGAVALFGEKYGESVRVISFDPEYSVELCGGTHVPATGQIGFFKITSESAIAAGVRRIEAITAEAAEDYIYNKLGILDRAREILKNPKDILQGAQKLLDENTMLHKQLHHLKKEQLKSIKSELKQQMRQINGINFIAASVDTDMNGARDLAFSLAKENKQLFMILGTTDAGKCNLTLIIAEDLVKNKNLNAGQIIREAAREIQGGGGGQAHFATAGGGNPAGLENAFTVAKSFIS